MPSRVSQVAAAGPEEALAHFEARLRYETDCWDVHDAIARGEQDFVLLDVRDPKSYTTAHIPGAINLPYGQITERRISVWPDDTLFIVYCAGPNCNGANRAAVKLARVGRQVKEMIGGVRGWADEGFTFATVGPPAKRTESIT